MLQNSVSNFQVITGSYLSHYLVSLVGIEPAIAKVPLWHILITILQYTCHDSRNKHLIWLTSKGKQFPTARIPWQSKLQLSSNDLWRRMSAVVLGVPHIVNMLTRQLCSHGRRKHTGHKQQEVHSRKKWTNNGLAEIYLWWLGLLLKLKKCISMPHFFGHYF